MPDYSYYVCASKYGGYVARCMEMPALLGEGETPGKALADAMEAVRAAYEMVVVDEGGTLPGAYSLDHLSDVDQRFKLDAGVLPLETDR